jgi:hypothetical protein
VLAAAIWIDACFEADVGAVVSRDDRLSVVAEKLRLPARCFLLGKIDIDSIGMFQVNVDLFEAVWRTP